MKIDIIYEDDDIIVVNKPAGIESQAGRGFDMDMLSYLRNYNLSKKEGTYVGLIHRLDKPVSGIMVFSKNENATNGLNRQFQEHSIVKKYSTIVCGNVVDKCGQLEDYIIKDGKNKIAIISNIKNKLAKKASLKYELIYRYELKNNILLRLDKALEDNKDIFSLLDIELETGRFHQIRVQLASRNMSILGDKKYANNPEYDTRVCETLGIRNISLKSYYLEFTHPRNGKRMSFEIDKNFNFCK